MVQDACRIALTAELSRRSGGSCPRSNTSRPKARCCDAAKRDSSNAIFRVDAAGKYDGRTPQFNWHPSRQPSHCSCCRPELMLTPSDWHCSARLLTGRKRMLWPPSTCRENLADQAGGVLV